VIFGAGGSWAGGAAVIGGSKLLFTASVLSGPGGTVIFVVGIAAAILGGSLGSEFGKWLGGSWYDAVSDMVEGWADAWVEIL